MKSVVGSGIAEARTFPKLFLMTKRSSRFTVPSKFASPVSVSCPKLSMTMSRSSWFIWPSLLISPVMIASSV